MARDLLVLCTLALCLISAVSQVRQATVDHRGSQQVTAQRTSQFNIHHHFLEHGCFCFIIVLETALFLDSIRE